MGSIVAGIHHVSVNVADLQRAATFYVDLLGLEVLPRPELGVPGHWLDAGGGRQVHLIERPDVPDDVGQHFAFLVDDIDAACRHLTDHGVEVRGPFPIADGQQAFFHDPDGNRLELNQPG